MYILLSLMQASLTFFYKFRDGSHCPNHMIARCSFKMPPFCMFPFQLTRHAICWIVPKSSLRGSFKSICCCFYKQKLKVLSTKAKTLTIHIQRTIYSLMNVLKYWLRNNIAGPRRDQSMYSISLFVICATWEKKSNVASE